MLSTGFNLLHLSLLKQFPLLILASSVCWSFPCLISALIQGGGGGHFFRPTCSFVLWRGRKTANKYHWHVWGMLSVSRHTGFAPAHGLCAFPVYTAQALGSSARNCLWWALGCMHFPGLSHSGSSSGVLHKGADLVGPAFSDLPSL